MEKQCSHNGIVYTLNRSPKRKSVAIEVRDGAVRVKAPLSYPISAIEDFIGRKSSWIQMKLDLWAKRNEKLFALKEFRSFLLHGVVYMGEFAPTKSITLTGERLLIPQKLQDEPRKLLLAIRRFYESYARTYLLEQMQTLSNATGLAFNGFQLTNAQRKWGSCTDKQDIRLNWRLVLLDKTLSDYVILHELCHTKYLNHSKNYWFLVKNVCLNYRAAKKEIKENALILGLYR